MGVIISRLLRKKNLENHNYYLISISQLGTWFYKSHHIKKIFTILWIKQHYFLSCYQWGDRGTFQGHPSSLEKEELETFWAQHSAHYMIPLFKLSFLNSFQEPKSRPASQGIKETKATSGAASLFLPSSKQNCYHISAESSCRRQSTLPVGDRWVI